ncbi:MAG: general secretion pathway protein GspK [Polyangiaceae bacterium]|nr:general secretion pathway protein GspK [Polyangiaceae bacterium]MCW5791916.1 general secretion pathway protein GspK [Polyangiaceae bacterium]
MSVPKAIRYRLRRRRSRERGVALIMVLGALTVLTVMLTEFQTESAADLSSALSYRDSVRAEYAAVSALNLSRLLLASEPTIRQAAAPIFLLMGGRSFQIPVWEFADRILGAFNDGEGRERFESLASVRLEEGENLGMEGAGFEVKIVDEDSKININLPAKGDAFSQVRTGSAIATLISGLQYDPLFEGRDGDGQFTDRQTLCAAIVDWTDPDTQQAVCSIGSETAQSAAPEDSFYQQIGQAYLRKNAAFDSLEELRMVRGMSDDVWANFVEPEPGDHTQRTLTVWGRGGLNVNTANAQALWTIICQYAVETTPMCIVPEEAIKFISIVSMLKSFTSGVPLFNSPKAFLSAMAGQGMFGTVLSAMAIEPVQFKSAAEAEKAITTESKVFSVVVTGHVRSGKRETNVRIHAVVDMDGAPPPAEGILNALGQAGGQNAAGNPTQGAPGLGSGTVVGTQPLPDGATEGALSGYFAPDPAGRILYYRVE